MKNEPLASHCWCSFLACLCVFIVAEVAVAQNGGEANPLATGREARDALEALITVSKGIYYYAGKVSDGKLTYTLEKTFLGPPPEQVCRDYSASWLAREYKPAASFVQGLVVFESDWIGKRQTIAVNNGRLMTLGFLSIEELGAVVDDLRHGTDAHTTAIFSRKHEIPGTDVDSCFRDYLKYEYPRKGGRFRELISSLALRRKDETVTPEKVEKYLGMPDSRTIDGDLIRDT